MLHLASRDGVVPQTFDGHIRLDSKVVIGAKGHVDGTVEARAVTVGGRVNGDVKGKERVEVLASGRLEGDVVAPKVVIADGAFFKGAVDMTGGSSAKGGGSQGKSGGQSQGNAKPAAGGSSSVSNSGQASSGGSSQSGGGSNKPNQGRQQGNRRR